jgi:hypothetical protein
LQAFVDHHCATSLDGIASNLLFILYGMLGDTYPVLLLHLTLLPISASSSCIEFNIVRHKRSMARKAFDPYLTMFLRNFL